MDIVSNSFEKCKSEENLKFEIQTDHLTARFKLEKQQLHCCSEKQEKNDIDTDEEKEEERMKIEDYEYICYVCGLRGNKLLDHSFGCNQQDAHRYCAIKDAKVSNGESLEGKGMSNELSEFFQKLRDRKISVIDRFAHFILKKQKQKQK